MRTDMSRVIVERPRRGGVDRRGRLATEDLPANTRVCADPMPSPVPRMELNEISRRCVAIWSARSAAVEQGYAEIAEASPRRQTPVQQHVRDHLNNFVAIKPRRRHGWYLTHPSDLK